MSSKGEGIPNVLQRIRETDQCVYYYTCPAKTPDVEDTKVVVQSYHNILRHIPPHKSWVWIIDTEGFGWKQMMQVQLATELISVVSNTYSEQLLAIHIHNPTTFMQTMLNMIQSCMSDSLSKKIKIHHKEQ
jgi:hypothetical protein